MHCVFTDGPYKYTEEFKEAVKTGCPENTDLHVLIGQTLHASALSDRSIYYVKCALEQDSNALPTDKDLLTLLKNGQYKVVATLLKQRIALQKALELSRKLLFSIH